MWLNVGYLMALPNRNVARRRRRNVALRGVAVPASALLRGASCKPVQLVLTAEIYQTSVMPTQMAHAAAS
jgi:hypothetical protein